MMRFCARIFLIAAAAGALLVCATPASAVIVIGGDTNGRNEIPPTGALFDQGWKQQGQWAGAFLGTPVSPEYFLTSVHVGVSSTFRYTKSDGTIVEYPIAPVNPYYDDPGSDLRLVKINTSAPTGAFEHWASIYNADIDGPEISRQMAVFGRGTQRGTAITGSHGWQWGAIDGVQTWGTNTVDSVVTVEGAQTLAFDFDQTGGSSEATLSDRDSSGGMFVLTGGVWKLAGINFGVDGRWKTDPGDTPYNAAIYDKGGLYEETAENVFSPVPDTADDQPASAYATRVAARLDFIGNTIGMQYVPEPATGILLFTICLISGRHRRHGNHHVKSVR